MVYIKVITIIAVTMGIIQAEPMLRVSPIQRQRDMSGHCNYNLSKAFCDSVALLELPVVLKADLYTENRYMYNKVDNFVMKEYQSGKIKFFFNARDPMQKNSYCCYFERTYDESRGTPLMDYYKRHSIDEPIYVGSGLLDTLIKLEEVEEANKKAKIDSAIHVADSVKQVQYQIERELRAQQEKIEAYQRDSLQLVEDIQEAYWGIKNCTKALDRERAVAQRSGVINLTLREKATSWQIGYEQDLSISMRKYYVAYHKKFSPATGAGEERTSSLPRSLANDLTQW